MSGTLLEQARNLHEDLEILEKAMYRELGDPATAHLKRVDEVARDQVVATLLDALSSALLPPHRAPRGLSCWHGKDFRPATSLLGALPERTPPLLDQIHSLKERGGAGNRAPLPCGLYDVLNCALEPGCEQIVSVP